MLTSKTAIYFTLIAAGIAAGSLSLTTENPQRTRATEKIGAHYQQEVRKFDSLLVQYPIYFYDSSYATRLAKYGELVRQFKRVEGLFTYFHTKTSYESFLVTARFEARDFGPPFPDNWIFIGPFGIDPDSILRKFKTEDTLFSQQFIQRAVGRFRKEIRESNYQNDFKEVTNGEIMESLRLQMVRISTMGLSNGDFVVDQTDKPGLEGAFGAWCEQVALFAEELPASSTGLQKAIMGKIRGGLSELERREEGTTFDRMNFLTEYLVPLARYLNDLQSALGIIPQKTFSALKSDMESIYDADVLNPDFFAPGEEAYYSKAKADLGRFLFFDPILSDNNERACASCHKPELAFTDGFVKSVNFDRGDLSRNAPTVINSVFQKQQFWDLRASSLEDQLDSVINNRDELHSSFENVTAKIASSPEYVQLFSEAFPGIGEKGIQPKHIKIAIATYERELTGLNSRFDQYVRGDKGKLSSAEINGFNLFMGKAKCGSCHYAPLFAGALPPLFEFTDHRAIGVPQKDTMKVYAVDQDTGASKVSKDPFHHFSFKVPTIRNVSFTAPYMHNGVFKTLEQVVDFYNDMAGMNFINDMRPGMKGLPFFMILPQKLNLTPGEKKDLVLFMRSLDDTSSARNVPRRLPALTGRYEASTNREIGGIY
ncbi:MAG TPA: cytochrome c peroxidase [Flavisolibacter sp.]|nr:cytochrome c peroxidase [Flavisolibacter sp.]